MDLSYNRFKMWHLSLLTCLVLISGGLAWSGNRDQDKQGRVLVLGAGMSGISAAKALHDKGFTDLLIIEGSDRIGGRLKEAKLGDFTVELGGTWIYGNGTTPMSALADRYGLSVTRDLYDYRAINDAGDDVTDQTAAAEDRLLLAHAEVKRKVKVALTENRPDFSLRSGLRQAGWKPNSAVDDAAEYYYYDFTYALPPVEVSARYLGEDYDDYFIVSDQRGYSHIIRGLANEFLADNDSRLHLNEVVSAIETTDGVVTVRTDRDNYTCDFAVVTFSVGVLQHRQVQFSPALPEWKLDAIDQFQMAHMLHIHLQFPTKFWNDSSYLLYAGDRKGYYSVWRNVDRVHPGSRILHAVLTGDEADRVARMPKVDVVSEAIDALQTIYGNQTTIPLPIAYRISDWLNDPLFRGSYSNWPPSYTVDTYKGLVAPVGPVYFAGEHVNPETLEFGFVHSAFTSGVKIAENIAACSQDVRACENYVPLYASRGCRYSAADNYDNAAREDDITCSCTDCKTSQAPARVSSHVVAGLPLYLVLTEQVLFDW